MEGFILVGGKSSRMGTDKAGLMIGGRSMLEHAAGALSTIADGGITVVGGSEPRAKGRAWIPDTDGEAITGPLIGLYTALVAASSDRIAVIACDLPFVTSGLFEVLAAIDAREYDAVVPMQPDGRVQPLCAIYRRETCLRAAKISIGGNDGSVRSMVRQVRTRSVEPHEYACLDNSKYFFVNVNTPDEYAEASAVALETGMTS